MKRRLRLTRPLVHCSLARQAWCTSHCKHPTGREAPSKWSLRLRPDRIGPKRHTHQLLILLCGPITGMNTRGMRTSSRAASSSMSSPMRPARVEKFWRKLCIESGSATGCRSSARRRASHRVVCASVLQIFRWVPSTLEICSGFDKQRSKQCAPLKDALQVDMYAASTCRWHSCLNSCTYNIICPSRWQVCPRQPCTESCNWHAYT